MDPGHFRALRFCNECKQWTDSNAEHLCPQLVQRNIAVARVRLEGWLGDFTVHQHDDI